MRTMPPLQLALPTMDMRPVCPVCGKATDVLGFINLTARYPACRECHERIDYPYHVFVRDTRKTRRNKGWRVDPEASSADLNRRIEIVDALEGRTVVDMVVAAWHRNRRKFSRSTAHTVRLPFCDACGCYAEGEYKAYCPYCEKKKRIEAMWQNRGVLTGMDNRDDYEPQLDKLQKVFPELFGEGLLPDLWFKLALEEKMRGSNDGK